MGLANAIGGIVRLLVRLVRIARPLLALGTLAGYVLLWLTLRQPEVTLASRTLDVLYLAAAASVALAVVVLAESSLLVGAVLGGVGAVLGGVPSPGLSGSSDSMLSPSEFGGGDAGASVGDDRAASARIDHTRDEDRSGSDDDGGGDGSVLGPHN